MGLSMPSLFALVFDAPDILVVISPLLVVVSSILIILIYVKLMLNQSDQAVQWHKREVECSEKHRERMERRFDQVESELRRLAEIIHDKHKDKTRV